MFYIKEGGELKDKVNQCLLKYLCNEMIVNSKNPFDNQCRKSTRWRKLYSSHRVLGISVTSGELNMPIVGNLN